MRMEKFCVSDKEAKRNIYNKIGDDLEISAKVHCNSISSSTESLPACNSTMRMLHHDNHYRPPSSSSSLRGLGGGDIGPTCNRAPAGPDDIYDVVVVSNAGSHAAAVASAAVSGDAVVRPLQPFDISTTSPSTSSPTTAFKFSGGMAATLGFPFTNAQWKELERQAMIYKYMVASVPVPPDLLLPINTRNLSAPAASQYSLGSDFSLRLSNNNTDPEPGRCKRTDGKKWRCSRDVAPDQKYCERHMHRGRPRSRKHVEVHVNNNKRTRHDHHHHHALPTTSSATMAVTNPTVNNNINGSHTQFIGPTSALPYHQSPVFLDKSTIKASTFDSSLSSEKESTRNLDWMMKAEPAAMTASDPQWHQLMQTKMELSSKTTSYCDTSNSSVFNQHSEEVPFLNLNSYSNFNTGQDQHESDQCSLFLNPEVVSLENQTPAVHAVPVAPRSFIDAWSNSTIADKSCVSSSAKLSPSSLTLSMGGCNSINEEMSRTHQIGSGYNVNHSKTHVTSWLTPPSWVAPQPGGPLAEVLRPSSLTGSTTSAVSNPSSPVNNGKGGDSSCSPVATTVSSPSGVLQKTLASLSDSSGSSSPTVVGCSSSNAKVEIALL
ncbi:growth-regulating factor 8 [Ziziphus jujuba]|uniref:Growth-regulating factor n=2 Tax=Ziziphus jujuba TaxID=326968 RepID=A0A6P3Z219_ZIZJJ|nr:growth-regulating factor 8 [Ziziphus jujuba]